MDDTPLVLSAEDAGAVPDDYGEEEPEDDGALLQHRRQARRTILRVLLFAAAMAAAVILILMQSANREFTAATYRKIADLTGEEGTRYLPLNGCVVAYSRDGASCMSAGGDMIWNITFEMQEPVTASEGGILAIGDYGGSTIYVCNSQKNLGTINTNMPIRAISVSASGEVAAVLDDTDVTWVYLFDSDGSTIAYFKTTMNQSGYPLAVAVSPSGEMVVVSHLIYENASADTSIAFYNFGAVGQNAVENNVAGFNYENEIFPLVGFLNDSVSYGVSDGRISFFEGKEIPKAGANAMFADEVQGVFAGDKYIGLLFPDTTGDSQYVLKLYDGTGQQAGTVSFSMDYTSLQIVGDRVVISNDQQIKIININGSLRYDGKFGKAVSAVIPTAYPNRYLIVTDSAVQMMVLE